MHVYIEMHVSSASTEAGQGMVQLLVGADGGTSGLNEDDFSPDSSGSKEGGGIGFV
jgi:hypothetical protein